MFDPRKILRGWLRELGSGLPRIVAELQNDKGLSAFHRAARERGPDYIDIVGFSDGRLQASASTGASAAMIASQKAGRSSGQRLVMMLPSTTTSSSTTSAPALATSVRIDL